MITDNVHLTVAAEIRIVGMTAFLAFIGSMTWNAVAFFPEGRVSVKYGG